VGRRRSEVPAGLDAGPATRGDRTRRVAAARASCRCLRASERCASARPGAAARATRGRAQGLHRRAIDCTASGHRTGGRFGARHAHADPASTRMLRVKMAVRLCRWMMAERPESKGRAGVAATTFVDLAQGYAREGAFVDWARFKLIGGDDLPGLSSAFVALRDAARKKAEAFNQTFAQALQVWNREPRAEPPACRWRRSSNACSPRWRSRRRCCCWSRTA
jgi:hypothetical protein